MKRRMRTSTSVKVILVCCGLLMGLKSFSQQPSQPVARLPFRTPGSDSIKIVEVLNANTYHSEQKDSNQIQYWVGQVRIRQGNTLIDCDSMTMNQKENYLESFGHVHITDDSTNIYSDYMKYLVDKRTVHFLNKVKLTDGKGILTTEDLQYDLNQKVGVYDHGGKVVNNGSVLTSEHATYYEETKDVYFQKNVVLRDPQYDLSADSLLYNTQTKRSTFITETFILFKDSTRRTVRTRDGYYDLNTHRAEFGKRPTLTDGSQKLTGDSIRLDDSTGINEAIGHAVYRDTAEGTSIIANYMISNKKNNSFLATQKPLMIIKQETDSLYLTCDTLYSGRLIDYQEAVRKAAITDSLHHRYVDSLYKIQEDNMRRLAIQDSIRRAVAADSLGATDSLGKIAIRDRSDSLTGDSSLGRLDSEHRLAKIDSLRKKSDSLKLIGKTDSLLNGELARLDSTQQADSLRMGKAGGRGLVRTVQKTDSARRGKITDSTNLGKITDSSRLGKTDSLSLVKTDSAKLRMTDSAKLAKTPVPPRGRRSALAGRPLPGKPAAPGAPGENHPQAGPPGTDTGRLSMSKPAVPVIDKDHEKYTDTAKSLVTDSSLRYILAYHHVRIFSDSMQAVADSMFYSGRDSIFRLFKNPIAWGNGGYQVTGDTMYIYTKNKKASRMYVFENGLAINKVAGVLYNQLKGTTLNCYFSEGTINYIRAKGNAESIYYVPDENKAYTGVNKAHSDIIDMRWAPKADGKGRELNKVVFRNDVEGSMIPMKKVNFDDMRLRGFKWQEDRRPKSKEELFFDEPPVQLKSGEKPAPDVQSTLKPDINPTFKKVLTESL